MATPKLKTKWTGGRAMVGARALLNDTTLGPVIKMALGEDWKAIRAVRVAVSKMLRTVDALKG